MKKDNPLKTVTAKRIIKEIELYTSKNSTFYVVYSNWYCGITNKTSISYKNTINYTIGRMKLATCSMKRHQAYCLRMKKTT